MELIILHGNGLTGSLNRLVEFKKKFDPNAVRVFSGKQVDFEQLLPGISTPSLFAQNSLAVLEDFEEVDLSKLPTDENLTVILRFNKNIPASSKLLKDAASLKAKIIQSSEEEELPIFPFLDMLAEKNPRALSELQRLLEQYQFPYILTMVFYMLRKMVATPKKISPYGLKKLEEQKKNFPPARVKEVYAKTLETEFKIKSGLIDGHTALALLSSYIISPEQQLLV